MPMEYRSRQKSTGESDFGWLFLCGVLLFALALAALPWIIVGLVLHRLLQRWISWKIQFLIWAIAFFAAAAFLFTTYQHGLNIVWQQEVAAYVHAVIVHQYDLAAYPMSSLWSVTWPIWLRTWPSIGIAGFVGEVSRARTTTVASLRQQERQRIQRAHRLQDRARKRTSRPRYVPDEVAGMMVIGVPIQDDEEDQSWVI